MILRRKPKVKSGIVRPGQPLRSRQHTRYVEGFCCCVCGSASGVKAAHLRLRTDGGEGLKPSDAWTTPLCFACHITDQHQKGERGFWTRSGLNPWKICIDLSHRSPDPAIREFSQTMKDFGA